MSPRGPLVVIDTNVWISGLLTRTGYPAQVARQVICGGQPVFSAETFAELKARLWRPKFDRYITLEQRKNYLADLDAIALWVEVSPESATKTYCRDPDDDKFIHAALAAGSSHLVTGDGDLLCLHPLGDLHILSPRDALTELGQME